MCLPINMDYNERLYFMQIKGQTHRSAPTKW